MNKIVFSNRQLDSNHSNLKPKIYMYRFDYRDKS